MMAHGKVVVGVDHGGFRIKETIIAHLESRGIEVTDVGVDDEISVDYPDVAESACREFLSGDYDLMVLACGTGIGISIAANKIDGIRCAVVHDLYTAEKARTHNNANAIAFGGRVEYAVTFGKMIDTFLDHTFEGGRHSRRIDKIRALES